MICPNCGKELSDQSSFCSKCGTPLKTQPETNAPASGSSEINAQPYTIIQPQESMQPQINVQPYTTIQPQESAQPYMNIQPHENAQPQTNIPPYMDPRMELPQKNGNGALIATVIACTALIIALIGCCIFAYTQLNSPMAKFQKALDNRDMTAVVSLYPQLKSEKDRDSAQEQILTYCEERKDAFENDEITYEELEREYDDFGKSIFDGNKEFARIVEEAEALNAEKLELKASNEAFEIAESLFAAESYAEALEAYSQVIARDEHYASAQDKMEACKEKMPASVTGKWHLKFDLGDYILEGMEMADDGYDLSFSVEMVFDFREDGSGSLYLDQQAMEDSMDGMLDDLAEIMYKMLEKEMNVDKDTMDSVFMLYYGKSLKDYLKEEMDSAGVMDEMSALNETFRYRVDGNIIYIDEESGLIFEMDGDDLIITGSTEGADTETLESVGAQLPWRLKKE